MVQKNLTEQEIDEEILQSIAQYNKQQTVLNDDRFEPLGNDSLIVVVQVILEEEAKTHFKTNLLMF